MDRRQEHRQGDGDQGAEGHDAASARQRRRRGGGGRGAGGAGRRAISTKPARARPMSGAPDRVLHAGTRPDVQRHRRIAGLRARPRPPAGREGVSTTNERRLRRWKPKRSRPRSRHRPNASPTSRRQPRRRGRRHARIPDRDAGRRRAFRAGPRRDRQRDGRRRGLVGTRCEPRSTATKRADDEYFRARAADLKDIRDQVLRRAGACRLAGRSRRRDPGRRRHRADALPRNRLDARRRHRADGRQFGEPCRDAGALARRADGGRAWSRCQWISTASPCSTPSTEACLLGAGRRSGRAFQQPAPTPSPQAGAWPRPICTGRQ